LDSPPYPQGTDAPSLHENQTGARAQLGLREPSHWEELFTGRSFLLENLLIGRSFSLGGASHWRTFSLGGASHWEELLTRRTFSLENLSSGRPLGM